MTMPMPNETKKGRADTLADFIKYNNAVPITLGLLFFATTGAFAASPEVRDAVYSTNSVVVSADTSYLESVNLEKYPFSMKVTSVTEDNEYYYVTYEFLTIEPVDAVWKSATRKNVLRVAKALLRNGELKTYVESELAQVRWQEINTLSAQQEEMRKQEGTKKVVVTTHSGLVGSLIKPTQEEVPQYHSEISTDDPLYVDNPRPLVTWDANKQGSDAVNSTGGVIHTTGTVIIGPDGTVSTSTDSSETEATSTEPASPEVGADPESTAPTPESANPSEGTLSP